MSDKRDAVTWVAIELTPSGEDKVNDGTLESALRRDLGVGKDHPIFIPSCAYVKHGKRVVVNLIEGYAFVGTGLPETTYFGLESTSYVEKIISTISGPYKLRVLNIVPNSHILKLRAKLQDEMTSDLEIGMHVFIVDGIYKYLDGFIVTLLKNDMAVVKINLRAKTLLATVALSSISNTDPRDLG